MNRLLTADHREAIAAALSVIPEGIQRRLAHVEFLTGTDPVFAGLHAYEQMSFGRSYRTSAHCSYRIHSSDATTTIVLPTVEEPSIIVHELGHALDELLGLEVVTTPVTWYAATDRAEAFAESFRAWLYDVDEHDRGAFLRDEHTIALFERLAA